MKVVTSFSSLLAVGFMKTRVRNSVTTAVTKKTKGFRGSQGQLRSVFLVLAAIYLHPATTTTRRGFLEARRRTVPSWPMAQCEKCGRWLKDENGRLQHMWAKHQCPARTERRRCQRWQPMAPNDSKRWKGLNRSQVGSSSSVQWAGGGKI